MAAVKRKAPASAPQRRSPSSSSSSSSSSSDDEEDAQVDAPLISSKGKRTNAAAYESESGSDSDSDSESESDSDPEPPAPPVRARAPAPPVRAPAPAPAPPVRAAEPVIVRQKPSESEEKFSDEDEDKDKDKDKDEGKPKSPPPPPPRKDSAEEPEKKKPKLSASAAARIWSQQDEIVLLRALSEFRAKAGNLPLSKDHGSFFLTVRGSIGFPLTQKQLKNKIRMMKENYSRKKDKGASAKFSKPHDKLVFDMSAKLFSGAEAQVEVEGEAGADADAGAGAEAEGGHNGDALPKSNFLYLRSFVENMITEREMPSSLMVQDVVAHIGQSRAQQMNAQIKILRTDAMKLRAREDSIKADLFEMMDS